MSATYYLKNMFWGFFIVAGIYWSFWGVEKEYKTLVLTLCTLSAFLYPFSKYLIEQNAVRLKGKDYWHRGVFRDGVPKTKMMLFYYVFCLVLAIPLGICCLILELKNSRQAC